MEKIKPERATPLPSSKVSDDRFIEWWRNEIQDRASFYSENWIRTVLRFISIIERAREGKKPGTLPGCNFEFPIKMLRNEVKNLESVIDLVIDDYCEEKGWVPDRKMKDVMTQKTKEASAKIQALQEAINALIAMGDRIETEKSVKPEEGER